MIAQCVSAGFLLPHEPKAPAGRQIPFPRDGQHSIASPSLAKAKEHEADKPQSLEAAKVSVVADLKSTYFHRLEIRPASFHQRRLRRTTDPRRRPSSRLRVRPFGLKSRRMAAKITKRRKRTLIPSDEAAFLEHSPRRQKITSPSRHCPQAVTPGPEGRQTVAQRVSAGFRPPMKTQPQRGDRSPLPARLPTFGPVSRARQRPGTPDVFACPLLPETHFHTETPRPIAPRMKRGSPRRSRRLGVKQLHDSYPSWRLGVRIFGMQTFLTPRHGARRAKRITAPCLTRRTCREIAFSFETRWGPQPRCG
jgi:hypothetical protein